MKEVYAHLLELLEAGQECALGLVVEAQGSTPQKPGAQALFLRDGRVIGTIGGGCLEMESRRRALLSLDNGQACLFDLPLNDDFGWDDGLICGGMARIFVQPLHREQEPLFRRLEELRAQRRPFVEALLLAGPLPEWVGRRCLLDGQQVFASELPSEFLPSLFAGAAKAMERETPGTEEVRYGSQAWHVYFHPHLPHPTLLIAGAGHIGRVLGHLGALIGFEVVVVDDRRDFANRLRFPEAKEIVVDDIATALARYPVDEDTYIVIVTRGHRHDAAALRACLASPARYIGMIGSRRKIHLIFRQFLEEGIATPEQLARIHTPVGLDIGAVTVEEIAVSIAAELIAVRRRGYADSVSSMRASHPVQWEKLQEILQPAISQSLERV